MEPGNDALELFELCKLPDRKKYIYGTSTKSRCLFTYLLNQGIENIQYTSIFGNRNRSRRCLADRVWNGMSDKGKRPVQMCGSHKAFASA